MVAVWVPPVKCLFCSRSGSIMAGINDKFICIACVQNLVACITRHTDTNGIEYKSGRL